MSKMSGMRNYFSHPLSSLLIPFILFSFIASAATMREEYEQTQQEIELSKERQAQLAEKTQALEGELKTLQGKLVQLADAVQKGEAGISDAEEKLRILSDQLKEKNEALKKHHKNLDRLVRAAISLSRTPPEAMIMMPDGAMDSMKTARALKMTSDDIRKETETIGLQLVELKAMEEKVEQDHQVLVTKQAALDKERTALTAQVAERTKLQKDLGTESKEESERLAVLAKKADNLHDFLSSVEKESIKRKAQETYSEGKAPEDEKFKAREKDGGIRSFVDAKGHIRTPVAGRVVQSFGALQGKNATSKGIVVRTRAGAPVTAPYDGEVVFAGPFLAYGQMVIIRHSDEFHTLLAGLTEIDVTAGQFLLEGEPIGAMGDSESDNKLYIELRKDNQPVNPASWISGLNKKN